MKSDKSFLKYGVWFKDPYTDKFELVAFFRSFHLANNFVSHWTFSKEQFKIINIDD